MLLIGSCVFLVLIPVNHAQSSMDAPPGDVVSSFHGSLSIVVGVMSVTLVVAFCAVLYAKLRRNIADMHVNLQNRPGTVTRTRSGLSGIDREVIESLPFFRFLSLKGSREGLECAVCLSRFEETHILRLLPKCKHAFHRDCIDQWLEKHSSCPLCRNKINAEDISMEDPNLELFVQRDEEHHGSSSRFSVGSSFRRIKQVLTPDQDTVEDDEEALLHKSNHKIIVSDVVFKHRWSNVSSSDLMFLNSENIIVSEVLPETSSDHSKAKRSMSDITVLSRSRDVRAKSVIEDSSMMLHDDLKETKMRNLWLPIAKNTVQWFAKREEKLPTQQLNSVITI